jgi:hypothetical protein
LSSFDDDEIELIRQQVEEAGKAILSFTTVGLNRTMNSFNKKEIKEEKDVQN